MIKIAIITNTKICSSCRLSNQRPSYYHKLYPVTAWCYLSSKISIVKRDGDYHVILVFHVHDVFHLHRICLSFCLTGCISTIRHLVTMFSKKNSIIIHMIKDRMKKRPERRKHCALSVVRRSQTFRPADPLPGGAGRPKFNQLEMVTTHSLPSPTNPFWWGSMHAISSYRGKLTDTQTQTPTNKPTDGTDYNTLRR